MEAPGDPAARPGFDASQEVVGLAGAFGGVGRPARLPSALAASALAHAVAVLLVASHSTAPPSRPALVAIPISLVARVGGGAGGSGGAPPPPAAAAPAEPVAAPTPAPAARPKPTPHPVARRPLATHEPAPSPEPSAVASAPGSEGATGPAGSGGAGPGGVGGGEGGGDGSGGARVAYGTNPLPPYPLVARRLGMEGVVLLDVVVAPDGHASDVRVSRTSGFPALDQSALTTVRERWRFVPARRDGVPVESRVTVPIRFRLDDAG
jgi:protein TonB